MSRELCTCDACTAIRMRDAQSAAEAARDKARMDVVSDKAPLAYQSGQSAGSDAFNVGGPVIFTQGCQCGSLMPCAEQNCAHPALKRLHLYADKTDARQTDSATMPADSGLFRKRYRALSDYEKALHDRIKDQADALARTIGQLNPTVYARLLSEPPPNVGRTEYDPAGVTLALRHLEDAVYRAVKALTA